MDKQAINLVNPLDIEEYLKKFCGDDDRLALLLVAALARIIRKSPEYMDTLKELPPGAPDWLRQKWNSSPIWHSFAPKKDVRIVLKVQTTLDWLKFAIAHDAAWLHNTDDQGRPKKLLKATTYEQLYNEIIEDYAALRAKSRAEGRKTLKEDVWGRDIKLVIKFQDGHKFVRLLNKRSLDRESAFLEHCIGDGGFDDSMESQSNIYYSLRAPGNMPCATISVERETGRIDHMAGQRNKLPDMRYMSYISALCRELGLDMTYGFQMVDGYKPPEDDEYALFRHLQERYPQRIPAEDHTYEDTPGGLELPDGLHAATLTIMNVGNIKTFPDRVRVDGNLYLYGENFPQGAPQGWTVSGSVNTRLHVFRTWRDFLDHHYPEQ